MGKSLADGRETSVRTLLWSACRSLAAVAALLCVGRPASAADLGGAGSTFVAPVMASWAAAYKAKANVDVVYQSVGSGAGIEKIEAGDVDFGATDKPLPPEELAQHGLCQFPIVIGGVAPVANVPGIGAGQLRFSGALLADIFLGKVAAWDSAEIRALNPGVTLPSLPISIVHRADGSGTTYNWTDFLAKASPAWRSSVGVGLSVPWPAGVGGEGNAGVAAQVKAMPGAIGYVEYAYAVQEGLAFGPVQNGYGLFVAPDVESFQAAAATVRWLDHKDFDVLMTDAGGSTAYPITATTFILMPKTPHDPARASAGLQFFRWALEEGEEQASDLHYAALPPEVVKLVEAYWKSSGLVGAAATSRPVP